VRGNRSLLCVNAIWIGTELSWIVLAFFEDTLTQANVLLEFAHFYYAIEESDTSRWGGKRHGANAHCGNESCEGKSMKDSRHSRC